MCTVSLPRSYYDISTGTTSAFIAAIWEYGDNTNTETDGEDRE